MKTRLGILMMVFIISSTITAQTNAVSFRLKGELLDSLTKDGEAYATVTVAKKEAPAEPVAKHVTDKNGRFMISVKGEGDFTATLSSLGRQPVVREFKALEPVLS